MPLLLGALGALGRPGIDLAPAFFASNIAFVYLATRAPSLLHVLAVGAMWGAGVFFVIAFGTQSWGLIVPVLLTLIGIALYSLPLALWAWCGPRLFGPRALFLTTAAGWSLWMDAGDRLGFPLKESTLSLVTVAPALLGGARLVGANLVCGVLNATWLGIAVSLADPRARSRFARALAALPAAAAGFATLAALAALAQSTAMESARSVQVGVPQVNADNFYYSSRMSPSVAWSFDENFGRLMASLEDAELVVMTEGFDGRFGLMLPSVREKWQRYASERKQSLLFASYTVEPNGWKGNAIAGVGVDGRIVGVHRKVDLAFYGERPLAAGQRYQVLQVRPDLVVGAPICQESILPGAPYTMTRRGAVLLAVSTSDVTFGSSITAFEHLAMTQIRAIEVGRTTVWASNGGPSGLIDRWGEFEARSPFRGQAAVRVTAPLHDDTTFFLRHAWVSSAVAVLVAVGLLIFGRTSQRGTSAPPAATPVLFLCAPPRPRLRAWGISLACIVVSGVLCCVSPALVELSRGDVARARASISEAFSTPQIVTIPRGRFETGPQESAAGAIAYFLTFYGIESSTAQLPVGLEPNPTLEAVQAYLERHFALRTSRIAVSPTMMPRVACLVRLRDGTYGVLNDWKGEGHGELFSPVRGKSKSMPIGVERELGSVGLIPALFDPPSAR